MTPLALNAALITCLGAGVLDLTLLNLAVVPALFRAQPEKPGTSPHAGPPDRQPGPTVPASRIAQPSPEAEVVERESREETAHGLELVAVVEFETSSHHFDSRGRQRLRQSLAALRDAPRIVIVGHADESGPAAFNDRLSRERAEAALRQLSARAIPVERVELIARGEREPLANGNSRRVEIYRGGER